MDEPIVTIITIAFNSARHIEQTIKSVIGQDYPNIEYIIVDGGSTDGTVDIIKKYEDRIARWVSEPDRGPTDAINKGVGMASGAIIALLNSDDYYADSTVIRRVVETFGQSEDIRMVYGILNYVDPDTGEVILRWGRDADPSEIRKRMYLPTPTIFSRREVWDSIGPYNESYNYADDYEWAIRALKFTRPCFIDYTITCMRDMGRSGLNFNQAFKETVKALNEHGYYFDALKARARNLVKKALYALGLRGVVNWVWSRNVKPRS